MKDQMRRCPSCGGEPGQSSPFCINCYIAAEARHWPKMESSDAPPWLTNLFWLWMGFLAGALIFALPWAH